MNASAETLKVGAVLFPGFELLDIFGPLEMLGMLGERVSITMVAEKSGAVRSNQGPKGVADLSFAEAPNFDLLIVPGGRGTRTEVQNLPFLDLIRKKAEEARFVASVCTGSALLAKTGILDGRRATSNKLAFDWVSSQGPNVTWIREARWVEDGVFFTSSGVSAGMDMTLGLIGRIYGHDMSVQIARWAEYTWQEDPTIDLFASLVSTNDKPG